MVLSGLTIVGSGAADSGRTRFNLKRIMCNRLASTVLKIRDFRVAVIARKRELRLTKRDRFDGGLVNHLWYGTFHKRRISASAPTRQPYPLKAGLPTAAQ